MVGIERAARGDRETVMVDGNAVATRVLGQAIICSCADRGERAMVRGRSLAWLERQPLFNVRHQRLRRFTACRTYDESMVAEDQHVDSILRDGFAHGLCQRQSRMTVTEEAPRQTVEPPRKFRGGIGPHRPCDRVDGVDVKDDRMRHESMQRGFDRGA